MKLYVVAQRGNIFTAGLIDGIITFRTDTISIKGIKFIPYSDIKSKGQVKNPEDFQPIILWMSKKLEDLFGVIYDANSICSFLHDALKIDNLWVNKKSMMP
jgi:hypothetical protein